jgi:hypothetical protein
MRLVALLCVIAALFSYQPQHRYVRIDPYRDDNVLVLVQTGPRLSLITCPRSAPVIDADNYGCSRAFFGVERSRNSVRIQCLGRENNCVNSATWRLNFAGATSLLLFLSYKIMPAGISEFSEKQLFVNDNILGDGMPQVFKRDFELKTRRRLSTSERPVEHESFNWAYSGPQVNTLDFQPWANTRCGSIGSAFCGVSRLFVNEVHRGSETSINTQSDDARGFKKWLTLVPPTALWVCCATLMGLGWIKLRYGNSLRDVRLGIALLCSGFVAGVWIELIIIDALNRILALLIHDAPILPT